MDECLQATTTSSTPVMSESEQELARLRDELERLKMENERLKDPPRRGNGTQGEGSERREVVYIPRERKCPPFSGKPGSLSIEDWLEEVLHERSAYVRIRQSTFYV